MHQVPVTLCILTCCFAVAACSPSDDSTDATHAPSPTLDHSAEISTLKAEVTRLTSENARLEAENFELRSTPSTMLANVETALRAGDLAASDLALKRLQERHPNAPETGQAAKQVETLIVKRRAEEREAERITALGFRALSVAPKFGSADTAIQLTAATISKRWIFDAYDDSWRYLESERGQKFLTAKVTVTSKSKDPPLFGIGVYVADGSTLRHLSEFRYRFARWDGYGSYLGNEPDYRNDFSHTPSIPFSIAATIDDEQTNKPLYIVVTRENCHSRKFERFNNPPVSYQPTPCSSLRRTLTVNDLKTGNLGILKRFN